MWLSGRLTLGQAGQAIGADDAFVLDAAELGSGASPLAGGGLAAPDLGDGMVLEDGKAFALHQGQRAWLAGL
jgi:hypothetical protein